eukprot:332054-Chlamydomonas_euryale.AAC.1
MPTGAPTPSGAPTPTGTPTPTGAPTPAPVPGSGSGTPTPAPAPTPSTGGGSGDCPAGTSEWNLPPGESSFKRVGAQPETVECNYKNGTACKDASGNW